MKLLSPEKYIYNSYPQNHPVIEIECEKPEDIDRIGGKIDGLFHSIKSSKGVDYKYQYQGRYVNLYIGLQESQEAIDDIQEAKKDLLNYIKYESDMPWWYFFITGLFTIISLAAFKILGWLFKLTLTFLKWIHTTLKRQFGLSDIQSFAIISSVIALITVLTFIFTDAKNIIFQSSTSGSQNSSNLNSSSTPNPTQSSLTSSTQASVTISEEEAVNLIKKWLKAKSELLSPPYNRIPAENVLTSKAYECNIHRTDGKESSVEYMERTGSSWNYYSQNVDKVLEFTSNAQSAIITVKITEGARLYNKNGRIDEGSSYYKSRVQTYNLQFVEGQWKISYYKLKGC